MGSHLQSFCKVILVIVFLATQTNSQPTSASSSSNISQIFEDWITEHDRVYSNSEEKAKRFRIFTAKYRYVQRFNKEGGKSKLYTVGLNRFSDMKRTEFLSYKCSRRTSPRPNTNSSAGNKRLYSSSVDDYCTSIDWSTERVNANGFKYTPVSPVRDQGAGCDACWAIAAVAATEAIIRVSHQDGYNFQPQSVQQVLDCAHGDRCGGGSEIDAYTHIVKHMGLASAQSYPYTGRNGTCYEPRLYYDHRIITGVALVNPPDEMGLRRAVCWQPVTAGIASNSVEFENYGGGIFNGPCGKDIDHTVLVVGFGEENGVKYWKIQNSWGDKWGEQGYMRLSFQAGVDCQIASEASFPLVGNFI